MEILRALQIARREWGNIKASLEMCGDIGEFDSKNCVNSRVIHVEGSYLVRNLIEMENKLPTYGYFTPEAAHVFTYLVSMAGERLGLMNELAQTFGSGYSWVRTGSFDLNAVERHHVIKQLFFFKIFFPLGGYFKWDFNSAVAKTKLKAVLYKFSVWQDSPSSYIQDVRDYKDLIEALLLGLSSGPGFSYNR